MKFKINPLVFILLFVVASSLLLYLLEKRLNRKDVNPSADTFVKATIKGKLTFKSLKHGIQAIRVDNDSQTFRFKPQITSGGSFFHANTDLGDSIIKKENTTDIMVKSGKDTWSYTATTAE